MTYDHLMPIFFQDKRYLSVSEDTDNPIISLFKMSGGLGFSTKEVGIIMSVNGIIALLVQGIVFPVMASWFGVWHLFVMVTVAHPVAYFIVPFLVLLPSNLLYPGIYACLSVRNFFSILEYPLLLILIKEAAPNPSRLGKINGLAASTGGACRTIASPIAGILYGMGSKIQYAPLAWWASALVAVVGAMQIPLIDENKNKTAVVRSAVAWRKEESMEERHKVGTWKSSTRVGWL
jgi:hypothetical protein